MASGHLETWHNAILLNLLCFFNCLSSVAYYQFIDISTGVLFVFTVDQIDVNDSFEYIKGAEIVGKLICPLCPVVDSDSNDGRNRTFAG